MNENLDVVTDTKQTITLFYGGVVNLGRKMNDLSKTLKPFVGITEMSSADLRLVDLECVIATKGAPKLTKNHFNFRAKPEQINILTKANVNIVLTANDHAGDYGAEALLEQREYLDAAGILHTGSGKNFSEAFEPVYKHVNNITLAIFSVDTTRRSSAAKVDSAGTAYLSPDNLELWKETFADRIRAAREKAHVVIVAPHWGANLVNKPSNAVKKIGRLLVDLGADAVLGCNSHKIQGVENYKDRPIIYDAGDLLFDVGRRNGGSFVLEISADGVEHVKFIPLLVRPGQSRRAINSAPPIVKDFVALCKEFNTSVNMWGGVYCRNIVHAAAA